MSKLSIITINYNDVLGLEKTILSVINQINIEFEFIIIDGGSNDGSKAVIDKYHNEITYSVSEKDNGIYHAMNKGIQASKGDYLLFLNSGDVLVDDAAILSVCQDKLVEDIVAFDCFLERDNVITGRRSHIENPTIFYVYKNGLKHQSTFIKRDLFKKLGLYNEKYSIAADYEFWIRCFLNPIISSKSYTIALSIYRLGGISEVLGWSTDFEQIKKELLPHLISDFQLMDKLLPYQNSRILKQVIKLQKWFKK